MLTSFDNAAFQRGIDPIFSLLTSEQARALAEYQVDDEMRERISELVEKCSEGELSDEEHAEYEGYVRANRFVSILQAKTRQRLDDSV